MVSKLLREAPSRDCSQAKRRGIKNAHAGSVALTQRAGSALNLNAHIHALMLDGVFAEVDGMV